MEFQFDAEKSRQNRSKHGIDFTEAQLLWRDPHCVEIPARTIGESRVATIGRIGSEVWVAIWTPRGAAIRLISVRRARPNERKLYEA